MGNDFKSKIDANWKYWEKRTELRIPDAFRESVELPNFLLLSNDETGLEDMNYDLERYFELSKYIAEANYFSNRKKPKVKGERRYQRSFEKQLYLVKFVIAATPVFSRKRIDWKQVCTQWNKAHPNDLYTKETLKSNYYKALQYKDIQRIYLEETEARIIEEVAALFGNAREADPVIDLFKTALRYVEEAEEIQDEVEANIKTIQSMILTHLFVDILRQKKLGPTPEGGYRIEQQSAQFLALGEILIRFFPELLTIQEGEEITWTEKVGQAITTIAQQAAERPEEFIKELISKGEGEYTESLIKALYDIDHEQLYNFIKRS